MEKTKSLNFSIVIPVLNEEKYLPLLLQDLAGQTTHNFEVVIVDGRSVDTTVAKAKEFKKSLHNLKIYTTEKRNVSFQRNYGASKASFPWIVFMDADNRLPDYFIEGVSYRVKLKNPDVFTCWVDVNSKLKADEVIARALNFGTELTKIAKNPAALGAMIGVTKNCFSKVGGFDESLGFGEDWDFVKRAFESGLKYEIFRDPKFQYSLRQLDRGGRLTALRRLAKVYVKFFSGMPINQEKEYPMGGRYEKTDLGFFDKVRENVKKFSKKPKFLKRIKAILDNLDSY